MPAELHQRRHGNSTPVCIVNEAFVRGYVRGRDPIGMHVQVSAMGATGPKSVVREIVGVSAQVKVDGLDEAKAPIEIYVPMRRTPGTGALRVQTAVDPLATPVRRKAGSRGSTRIKR